MLEMISCKRESDFNIWERCKNFFHLFEILIENSVQDGVGAGRGNADNVEEKEESHHVLGGVEPVRYLGDQAEQAGMEEFKVEAGNPDLQGNNSASYWNPSTVNLPILGFSQILPKLFSPTE